MKVLHFETGRHLYGGAQQVIYLIKGIQDVLAHAPSSDLCEQILVCPQNSDIANAELGNCEVLPIPYKGEFDVRALHYLKRIVREKGTDILHTHSRRGADLWGVLAANQCNIPAVCTRRVDNKENKFAAFKYQRYHAVTSISQGVHNAVSPHCSRQQLQSIIHSAVNFTDYERRKNRTWLNETFNVPTHHQVIANFAQLIHRKGQFNLINAMKMVLQDAPNTTCLLFGKGKMASLYQAYIDELGLNEHVKLCGFTEQVACILPCVDVVVHPAHAEGLGVILLQAAAAKCAIAATKAGGIPEIIIHEKTGLLSEPEQDPILASHILRLLRNPRLRHELGENAYQHVQEGFSIPSMSNAYLSLYNTVLNKKRPD